MQQQSQSFFPRRSLNPSSSTFPKKQPSVIRSNYCSSRHSKNSCSSLSSPLSMPFRLMYSGLRILMWGGLVLVRCRNNFWILTFPSTFRGLAACAVGLGVGGSVLRGVRLGLRSIFLSRGGLATLRTGETDFFASCFCVSVAKLEMFLLFSLRFAGTRCGSALGVRVPLLRIGLTERLLSALLAFCRGSLALGGGGGGVGSSWATRSIIIEQTFLGRLQCSMSWLTSCATSSPGRITRLGLFLPRPMLILTVARIGSIYLLNYKL